MEIVMPPGSVTGTEHDRLASELAALFGHDLAEQPPIAMQQLLALRRFDGTARLSELTAIRTLVVSAAHDPIAPPRLGRAAGMPGARFGQFDDAAHGLPIQHARRVNALLGEHFIGAEPVRRNAVGGEVS